MGFAASTVQKLNSPSSKDFSAAGPGYFVRFESWRFDAIDAFKQGDVHQLMQDLPLLLSPISVTLLKTQVTSVAQLNNRPSSEQLTQMHIHYSRTKLT